MFWQRDIGGKSGDLGELNGCAKKGVVSMILANLAP